MPAGKRKLERRRHVIPGDGVAWLHHPAGSRPCGCATFDTDRDGDGRVFTRGVRGQWPDRFEERHWRELERPLCLEANAPALPRQRSWKMTYSTSSGHRRIFPTTPTLHRSCAANPVSFSTRRNSTNPTSAAGCHGPWISEPLISIEEW